MRPSGGGAWLTDTGYSLRDDDLAYLMSMNTKDLHKLCGRLREDRFLEVYVASKAAVPARAPSYRD